MTGERGRRLDRIERGLGGDTLLDPGRDRARRRRLAAAAAEGSGLSPAEILAEAERILADAAARGLTPRELMGELAAEAQRRGGGAAWGAA